MRTYDPADRILYVHLTPGAAGRSPSAQEECHALPAGHANAFLRQRVGRPAGGPPALVLLPGGAAPDEGPVPAAPVLSLAR